MQYKVLATLFFAATALAAPADSTATDSDDTFDIADVPSSVMSVLATAIPESWYNDLLDPASLSAIESAASAGTYPAWYNSLPSDVKSWATGQFGAGLGGASATADSSATQTGSSLVSSTASQTSSNAAETTSASSDSTSSSASSSPSSSQSTGGAPAPTGGVAMGVAGAAGILALALAL
ncbi:hypothetical protein N7447_000850 [Penicillium robsamsonii]|uniref:uncharacterized protein n=1 Tax=Penicillium robsamsonii TaxID=1792511 RepID=UPI0025497253|nr:uncharacterized protein N7447_000850 [Penicillium robsamsonii]KAJ5834824.1 hypothetical protein N7447_000850 [Penicillium robsamsonii]